MVEAQRRIYELANKISITSSNELPPGPVPMLIYCQLERRGTYLNIRSWHMEQDVENWKCRLWNDDHSVYT